jgi:hypothetical protein
MRSLATRASTVVAMFAMSLATTSCTTFVPHVPAPETTASWRAAKTKLATLREASRGQGARTLRLLLLLREPYTGKSMQARGAAALAPPENLRMILVGPGGTTALDLWIADDKFRFEVPAVGIVREGDRTTPAIQKRGLPIDFLRWWMLRPAEGELLFHEVEPDAERFVLRDGRAIVDLHVHADGRMDARRREHAQLADGSLLLIDDESVEADKLGCGQVHYHQQTTGLDIHVTCEGVEPIAPDPRAFDRPEAQ